MVWLVISIMKRCTERYALQLHQTSLRYNNKKGHINQGNRMYKDPPTKAKGQLFTILYINRSLDKQSPSDGYKTNMVKDTFKFEIVYIPCPRIYFLSNIMRFFLF